VSISRSIRNSTKSAAHFATRWLPPSTAIVTAHGELDAANASEFFTYTASHSGRMTQLVLDLTGVDFFGTAGFSALHTLNQHCATEGVTWILVPSPAVDRLLHICDSESALPVQPSIEAALGDAPPLLQLVAESS
jgi:anti-anti-sigma factor